MTLEKMEEEMLKECIEECEGTIGDLKEMREYLESMFIEKVIDEAIEKIEKIQEDYEDQLDSLEEKYEKD